MTNRNFTKSCVAVGLAMLAPLAFAQPSNDSCSGAIGIGVGNTGGNNALATTGLPTFPCGTPSSGKDLWYSFTAPCTGTASAGTCPPGSATFDSVVAVWNGAGGCCSISLMGCNDDFAGCGLQSKVLWPCLSGTTYYISVGSWSGGSGSFVLNVSCTAGAPPPPANDTCSGAVLIVEHQATAGSNFGASTGPDPAPPCVTAFADVWFRFNASVAGTYNITTCHPLTNFDTVLAAWTGGTCAATNLGCNDDSCGTFADRSTFQFVVTTAGSDVRISVAGYAGLQGTFMLTVSPALETLNFHFFHNGYQTLGFEIIGGPPSGTFFVPITLNAGAFPYGWLLGIDITLGELGSELNNPPFSGTLTSCGTTRFGPISGVPSGLTLYGVGVASPVGMPGIIETGTAEAFTVP